MIKILFVIPTLSGGGAERVLVNLVNNLDKAKYDISILSIFDGGINRRYINSNVNYDYVFKHTFRGYHRIFKLFSPKTLADKFIKGSYDIIASYLQGPTTRIVSGIDDKNTIKLNWVHSTLSKRNIKRYYRDYNEFIYSYNQYDATIFVSKMSKTVFENEMQLNNNHKVIYNTVDSHKIKILSNQDGKDMGFDKKKFNLITIGRLNQVKGYDRLLKIVKKLSEDKFNFHLYILGEGKLEKKLSKYISDNNLSEYVTLLGFKENPYIYLKYADLYICSSYIEGFSTAVTESLIVGTPVITTSVSGMTELLGENNNYGVIVNNDIDSLYQGVKLFLNDEEYYRRYKNKTVRRGMDFNTSKTVAEVEKYFEELLKK